MRLKTHLAGRYSGHARRASRVFVAAWGGRGGHSYINTLSGVKGRKVDKRTDYGSTPQIGILVVLRVYKEEASDVGWSAMARGRCCLRRWGRTRHEVVLHLSGTRKIDEETLESGVASLCVELQQVRLRRTACPNHVALRFSSEDPAVEVEWPQSGLTTLTGVGEFRSCGRVLRICWERSWRG